MPSSSKARRTLWTCTLSRSSSNSSGSVSPLRAIVMCTLVPLSPRMRSIVSSSCSGSTGMPSIERIVSPAFTPARCAGVPSIGVTTRTIPLSSVTSMPTPEYSPDVLIRTSLNCSRSKYAECGSRFDTMPRIAAWRSSLSETSSTYSALMCSSTSASRRASLQGMTASFVVFCASETARSAWTVGPIETPRPSTTPSASVMANRNDSGMRDIWCGCEYGAANEAANQNRAVAVLIQCGDRCRETLTRRTSHSSESRHPRRSCVAHDPWRAAKQFLQHDLEWPRSTDREPLPIVDAEPRDRCHDRFALDALGRGLEPHRLRELHDRGHHRLRTCVACEIAHQLAVDLEMRYGKRFEIRERRQPSAEIIQRDVVTEILQ